MKQDDVAKAFEARFLAALAAKATNADFDKLRQFIEKMQGPDAAQACLLRYLELFPKHENTTTRSRTLATFYLVLKRRIEVAGRVDDVVDTMDTALRHPQKPLSTLQERFAALDPADRGRILELLTARQRTPKRGSSIMDELRAAYRRANHKDARSLAELYGFDPLPDDKQRQRLRREYDAHRKLFDDAYSACRANPTPQMFAMMRGYANVYWSFVKSQRGDPLQVFQLLRFWRLDRATSAPSPADEIAYMQVAAGLLYCAAHLGYPIDVSLRQPPPRTQSVPEPEVETFVLEALRTRHVHYVSSYKTLFEQFFANVPAFLDQCDLFLRLRIFASRTFNTAFGLASEEEFVHVVSLLVNTPDEELEKLSFQIERAPGRWEHTTGSRQIGEWIGTKLRIVYFEGPRPLDVYVEHAAARGLLFKVPIGVVVGFANDAVFDLVFEFNKHLLTLIPAFFELLMYIPGIVERGVFGLVQMLIDPLVEKAAGEVLNAFGFDPSKAGFWVGGLALLTHRIKPKLGKQPVRGLDELAAAENRALPALPANPRSIGAGAAAVETRELGAGAAAVERRGLGAGAAALETGGLGGDLARADARGLHVAPGAPGATPAKARAIEIVEPKGMTKAGGTGRQFDQPWLDRATTPAAAEQRAAGKAERAAEDAGATAADSRQPLSPYHEKQRRLQEQQQLAQQRLQQEFHEQQQRLQLRQQNPAQQQQARMGGDPGKKATAGKGVDQPATAGRLHGQPSAVPELPSGTQLGPSGLVMIAEESSPLLSPLKRAGFEVEQIGVKSPKGGGGRYQATGVTGLDREWRVHSPSGTHADLDGLAMDPLKPGGLVSVESKATFVKDVDKSAHLAFYPDKVEGLTRQLVLCLESRGLMRMEIVCNAREVAEVYQNMVVQQIAREVKKNFREQARTFIQHSTDKAVKRLSLADLEQMIEDHITVTVSEWGKLR